MPNEEIDGLNRAVLLAKTASPEPSSDDGQKTEEARDEIRGAVEARCRTLEASVALATDDERDRIARDIDACKSLLRKLDLSGEART